jgi:hypothetical protein
MDGIMNDIENSEKTLYDLLIILCDILSSENIVYHEEILCQFIRTIELQGKPLKLFIQITFKHKHLRSALENTFRNMSYTAYKNILEVMQEMWPEDIEMINHLQHIAHTVSSGLKHNASIHHILCDAEIIGR